MLLISILGIHLYTASAGSHYFPSRWFTRDDAYYYFKVAQNISEGNGSTFDGMNLTNGYHPLWMLVCIPIFALARFDLVLPLRVLMVVMALLSAGTAVILFRVLRKAFSEKVSIALVAFWAYTINVHSTVYQQGMETGVVVFFSVLLLAMLQKIAALPKDAKMPFGTAFRFSLVALLLLLSRLDMIFIVLFASLFVLLRNQPVFRGFLLAEAILAYVAAILLFISRTDLAYFLAVFDLSALLFTGIALVGQVICGWLMGLYLPSGKALPIGGLVRAVTSATVGSGLGFAGLLVLNMVNPAYNIPRLVPPLFGLLMGVVLWLMRGAAYSFGWREVDGTVDTSPLPPTRFVRGQAEKLLTLLRGWLPDAVRLAWVSLGGLLAYMLMNTVIFGTMMPVSGQIKRWWGSMQNNVYGGPSQTIANIFGLDPTSAEGWLYISIPFSRAANQLSKLLQGSDKTILYWVLIGVLMVISLVAFWFTRNQTIFRIRTLGFGVFFLGSFFQILFYGASGYSAKHEWYWAPQMLVTVIFFGLLLQIAEDVLGRNQFGKRILAGALVVYVGVLFVRFNVEMVTRMPLNDLPADRPFIDMIPKITESTEPGSIIGMTGGGNIGYYIEDRTIMNMDGLINSYEYFGMLKDHRAGEFYQRVGLDYVFASKYILTQSAPYRYQFAEGELQEVKGSRKYGNKELLRYVPAP